MLGKRNLGQDNLGPSDDPDNDVGDLTEAFDAERLKGEKPPIPASEAAFTSAQIKTLPHLATANLFEERLHERRLRGDRRPADRLQVLRRLQERQADRPVPGRRQSAADPVARHADLGHLDALTQRGSRAPARGPDNPRGRRPAASVLSFDRKPRAKDHRCFAGLSELSFSPPCLALACARRRAQTLASIKASHHLDCGTVQSVDDWNGEDIHGDLSALGGEICRAVAVAILGGSKGSRVQAFPAEPEALAALKAGKIQLAVGISPSATVATQFGVGFGPPVFYNSATHPGCQSRAASSTSRACAIRVICALDMSPPERTLRDELTARNISYALQAHSEQGELDAAVAVRRCVGTGMESRLAQSRANFHARTSDFVFLPERLALAPVVPAYPDKDRAFGLIVDWTVSALIEAEALGITKDNVAEAAQPRGHAGRSASRPRLRHRAGAWPGARLGREGHRGHRQLRGDFRANDGQALSA